MTDSPTTPASSPASEKLVDVKLDASVTGANRALLKSKTTTDPPPQFNRLDTSGGGKSGRVKPSGPSDVLSDLTSQGSDDDSGIERDEPGVTKKADVKVEKVGDAPDVIVVKFFSKQDPSAAPREVYVPTDAISLAPFLSDSSAVGYTARLSAIVPAAIKIDSPIKARGGHVLRPPIHTGGQRHQLGKLEDILAGKSEPLAVRLVDEYELRHSDGLFTCHLYLDQSDDIKTGEEGPLKSKEADDRLMFTGEGSNKPLDIATDRAKHQPKHKLALPGITGTFLDWLRTRAHEEGKVTIPASRPHASLVGDIFDRYLTQIALVEFYRPWLRSQNGYIVPANLGKYSGVHFTKMDLYDILRVKHTTAAKDASKFHNDNVSRAPRALEWVSTKRPPSGFKTKCNAQSKTHDAKFRPMKPRKFDKYLDNHSVTVKKVAKYKPSNTRASSSKLKRRAPSTSPSASSASSGSEEEDLNSEEEEILEELKAKKAAKRSKKASIDSDNLEA
ncbi:hypothetical protein DFH09DRAFT_1301512 [Mycena vulgaris]|nr:hypothetical protein DFH09DRAFT_1301512 [Mycena vulgaris]